MRIGICDALKSEREWVKHFLQNENIVNRREDVITLYSPEDVLSDLEQQIFLCDIMIMGIEFGKEDWNGITLTKKINEQVPSCRIIYLTHHLEYAPEVYSTEHCYFVLKKDMEAKLPQAMLKAKALFEQLLTQSAVRVISDGHTVYIMRKEILYAERQERKIIIHTKKKRYVSYTSLSEFLNGVSDEFVRCHGGYVVNLLHITYLGRDSVTVDEEIEIPVGKTYSNTLKQKYRIYWSQKV